MKDVIECFQAGDGGGRGRIDWQESVRVGGLGVTHEAGEDLVLGVVG